ncbi:Ig-like domain-containing protein, partial [Bacillus cereus]|uniref:Ig-like domain-containing protein n=1 Tax=Bacillus cereus TaxID=1396 RepID=UPI000279C981
MGKQKKRMNQLKPVNVVTTAAIVATTLFTPIVDILPGKYNIVHAEVTQNPANYGVIDASNKWAGLQSLSGGTPTQYFGNYVRFKSANSGGVRAVPLRSYAQTAVEAKIRADADNVYQFDEFGYMFTENKWVFRGKEFTPLPNEVPEAGEWVVWKVIYDKIAKKKTLYLNGKKILEGDTPVGITDTFFSARHYGSTTAPVNIDVEYVNYSNSVTSFVPSPKVNPVTDAQMKLTGSGKPGATVIIESNGIPGKYQGTVDGNGNFSIGIPKQKAGTELTVTQALDGTTSEKTVVTVKDGTPPDVPKVNTVTDQDTQVSGTGEKGATVKVVVDGKEVGTGKVDDQGNYTVDISKQPVGKDVLVTLTDAAGNTSQPVKTKVETKDVT